MVDGLRVHINGPPYRSIIVWGIFCGFYKPKALKALGLVLSTGTPEEERQTLKHMRCGEKVGGEETNYM